MKCSFILRLRCPWRIVVFCVRFSNCTAHQTLMKVYVVRILCILYCESFCVTSFIRKSLESNRHRNICRWNEWHACFASLFVSLSLSSFLFNTTYGILHVSYFLLNVAVFLAFASFHFALHSWFLSSILFANLTKRAKKAMQWYLMLVSGAWAQTYSHTTLQFINELCISYQAPKRYRYWMWFN